MWCEIEQDNASYAFKSIAFVLIAVDLIRDIVNGLFDTSLPARPVCLSANFFTKLGYCRHVYSYILNLIEA
jgi:hypothetical protein